MGSQVKHFQMFREKCCGVYIYFRDKLPAVMILISEYSAPVLSFGIRSHITCLKRSSLIASTNQEPETRPCDQYGHVTIGISSYHVTRIWPMSMTILNL